MSVCRAGKVTVSLSFLFRTSQALCFVSLEGHGLFGGFSPPRSHPWVWLEAGQGGGLGGCGGLGGWLDGPVCAGCESVRARLSDRCACVRARACMRVSVLARAQTHDRSVGVLACVCLCVYA
jgi:hypothetical protein